MKGVWQAVMFLTLSVAWLRAEEAKPYVWNAPKITQSIFMQELGMLDAEREEYATNLANHAASLVISTEASLPSLAEARRILALALHLSPRNKRALVIGFQLSKGMMPDAAEGNYSPQALAKLLYSRGRILEDQGGAQNALLARMFMVLASSMDPRNEDAVYASEVHRLDHGEIDWSVVTDPKPAKP